MLFTRINRTNPEKLFLVVYNSYGTADLTVGQAASWDIATDADGVSVTAPVADKAGYGVAGVAPGTITKIDYGLIQVWGYHSATRCRTLTATDHTYHESVLAGAAHGPLASNLTVGKFCLEYIGSAETAQCLKHCAVALDAVTTFTSSAIAVIIQAL